MRHLKAGLVAVLLVAILLVGLGLDRRPAAADDDFLWLRSIPAGLGESADSGRPVMAVFR